MRNAQVLAGGRAPRMAGAVRSGLAGLLVVTVGLLAGYGWLYVLRAAGWFAAGPKVGDSLPLLQLAGFDAQPLSRVVVAWLLAGALAGLALIRAGPGRRAVLAGVLALLLLLLAAQAAYALARNLRLTDVLLSRDPGLGPWLEAVLFGAGCALPRGFVPGRKRKRVRSVAAVPMLGELRHLGLGGGQHRDAAEHDGDRGQVGEDRDGVRA